MAFLASQDYHPTHSTADFVKSGKRRQRQFQCGWAAPYLGASSENPPPLNFQQFRGSSTQSSQSALPSLSQPTQLNSDPSSPSNPKYFVAGRQGCGFVKLAHDAHVAQKKKVTILNCANSEASKHPVCVANAQHRRGTPSYYKQTGPDTYEFVRSGYSEDLSFMDE